MFRGIRENSHGGGRHLDRLGSHVTYQRADTRVMPDQQRGRPRVVERMNVFGYFWGRCQIQSGLIENFGMKRPNALHAFESFLDAYCRAGQHNLDSDSVIDHALRHQCRRAASSLVERTIVILHAGLLPVAFGMSHEQKGAHFDSPKTRIRVATRGPDANNPR